MFTSQATEHSHSLVDQPAESAKMVIESTQRAANAALDSLADASDQLRSSALRMADSTAKYIQNDPIKMVLMAALTGAVLMVALLGVVGATTRSHTHH